MRHDGKKERKKGDRCAAPLVLDASGFDGLTLACGGSERLQVSGPELGPELGSDHLGQVLNH